MFVLLAFNHRIKLLPAEPVDGYTCANYDEDDPENGLVYAFCCLSGGRKGTQAWYSAVVDGVKEDATKICASCNRRSPRKCDECKGTFTFDTTNRHPLVWGQRVCQKCRADAKIEADKLQDAPTIVRAIQQARSLSKSDAEKLAAGMSSEKQASYIERHPVATVATKPALKSRNKSRGGAVDHTGRTCAVSGCDLLPIMPSRPLDLPASKEWHPQRPWRMQYDEFGVFTGKYVCPMHEMRARKLLKGKKIPQRRPRQRKGPAVTSGPDGADRVSLKPQRKKAKVKVAIDDILDVVDVDEIEDPTPPKMRLKKRGKVEVIADLNDCDGFDDSGDMGSFDLQFLDSE